MFGGSLRYAHRVLPTLFGKILFNPFDTRYFVESFTPDIVTDALGHELRRIFAQRGKRAYFGRTDAAPNVSESHQLGFKTLVKLLCVNAQLFRIFPCASRKRNAFQNFFGFAPQMKRTEHIRADYKVKLVVLVQFSEMSAGHVRITHAPPFKLAIGNFRAANITESKFARFQSFPTARSHSRAFVRGYSRGNNDNLIETKLFLSRLYYIYVFVMNGVESPAVQCNSHNL